MATRTIYAYSSNNITLEYEVSAARSGENIVFTVAGTIFGNGSSSDPNYSLYLHLRHNVSPSNTTGTGDIESYGDAIGSGVFLMEKPNGTKIPQSGWSFSKTFTVNSKPAATTYSNVAVFTSKSSSSPSTVTNPAYCFIGKKSDSISGARVRYYTESISVAAATYTVSYNKGANGTGTNSTATKTYGTTLTLKGAQFTRTGYTQTGWSKTDGGAQDYALSGSYTTNAAVTLYPVWTINTYTISYNKGSHGTGTNTTATKTYNVALTLKGATFTRSGYYQSGWATSDGGSKAYELSGTYTANAAATLYPVWTAYKVTIKFNVNGGTIATGTGTQRYRNANGGIVQVSNNSGSTWTDVTNTISTGESYVNLYNVGTYGCSRVGYDFEPTAAYALNAAGTGNLFNQDTTSASSINAATIARLTGSATLTSDKTVTLYIVWDRKSPVKVKVGGTWYYAPVKVKNGGTWKEATLKVKNGGSWKT